MIVNAYTRRRGSDLRTRVVDFNCTEVGTAISTDQITIITRENKLDSIPTLFSAIGGGCKIFEPSDAGASAVDL